MAYPPNGIIADNPPQPGNPPPQPGKAERQKRFNQPRPSSY